MYKFAILLIPCFLAAINPVECGIPRFPTDDEVLESTFRDYQNYLGIGYKDLYLQQFFVFVGDDVKSRKALFEYFYEKNIGIAYRNIINVDRFKTFLAVVSKAHDKDVAFFAKECLEKVKRPRETTINATL
ncbi:uncharacterized protein LOC126840827 [Adelges cooleyi]|uniref:uncharacterized protein LOC126840827 n=1 Tax=Adelges cooleyi TaxID=133065 RepID=UPI00218027CD|nr:uncharacterized protein LOC126840827 [Adelges cooleyi]